MAEWKVRSSTRCCFGCSKTFQPEEPFCSALYFVPPEIERRDFCPECWGRLPQGEALAYWTLKAPEEETDPADVGPLDLNRLKRLIKVDLQRSTAPPGLAGLLALMMARRRMARVESVEDGRIRVRFRDEDESVEVPAPALKGEVLERAQVALWSVLDQIAESSR